MIRLRKMSLPDLLFLFTLLFLLPSTLIAADTVYTVNNNGSVSVIETVNDTVTTTIPLPSGSSPAALCLNPVTPRAYTLNSATNSISVLDTTLQKVIATISDVARMTGVSTIACDPTGKSVLIGNNDTPGTASRILYLNTATLALESSETVVGKNPGSIVFNKSGSKAYVLSQGGPSISVIDTSTKQVTTTTPLLDTDAPYALAMHTRDTYLYVVNLTGNSITFIDPATMGTIPPPLAVGNFPNALAVSNTTNMLYVADYLDAVSRVDPVSKSRISSFSTPFPGAIIERNDGRRLYVASMSDDIIRSYDTSLLTTAPVLIPLPARSSPRALATLSGTRHVLGLAISGNGSGSVNWPFNLAYTASTSASGNLLIPEGISVTTNAAADICSTVNWTGCDLVSGGSTRSAFCTVNPFTADKGINAIFTANAMRSITYTVPGGNGAISCPALVCDGGNAVCSIAPNTGYTLTSLTDNGKNILGDVTGGVAFQILNIVADHSIVAGFTINSFTVTASTDANGSISPNAATVVYGNPVSFTLTPNPGLSLFSVTGCGGLLSGNIYTTGPITGNCSVSAAFAPGSYTITSQTPGGGGSVSCQPTVLSGGNVVCTVSPTPGYHLAILNDNGKYMTSAVAGTSYQITNVMANHDVVALFAINQYQITLAPSTYGSITGPVTVNYGDKPTYAFTPSGGYHVSSVIVNGVSVGAVSSYTFPAGATGPVTISATFTINSYTVTPPVVANGAITPAAGQPVNYGSTASFTLTPATGYHIASVGGTCGGTVSGTTYTTAPVIADCTVIASFTLNSYTVTATPGVNGFIDGITSPSVKTVFNDATTSFALTASPGYSIVSVTGCGGKLNTPTGVYTTGVITGDCSVSATFMINTYVVTSIVPGGNGTVVCTSPVSSGSSSICTITPATGYQVATLTDNGLDVLTPASTASYTVSNIIINHSIQASFSLKQFMVTPSVVTNGAITPAAGQPVNSGSTASFTLTPATGYHIDTVGGTCGGTLIGTTYTTAPITSACGVSATFTLNQYQVTPAAGTGGSISPATVQNIVHGSSAIFTITPATAGYSIVSVTGCGGMLSGNSYTTGAITADCTASAVFTLNSYSITPSIPGGNGAVSCASTIANYGTSVSCTITPANGYRLSTLLDNGLDVLAAAGTATYTISNITANHALAATFSLKSYAVAVGVGANGRATPNAVQMVTRGNTTSFTLTPDTGYHIDTISGTCGGTVSGTTYTTAAVTADCAETVTFALNGYTVSATAGNGGNISPSVKTVSYGATPSFALTASPGYFIASVTGCNGTLSAPTGVYTTGVITGDCSISATFIAAPAPISTGNGIITCSQPAVSGDSVNCLITPYKGYHLASLTDNGVNVLPSVVNKNSYSLAAVTSAHSINASFAAYSLVDALQALRIAVNIASPKPDELLWLDVAPIDAGKPKGNGVIDIMDALVLLKQSIGIYTTW